MIPAVMAWYYSKMGLQQGPVPEDELKTKIRRGEVDGTNLVWKDGMAEWKPLSQVPELMAPSMPATGSLPEVGQPDVSQDEPSSMVPAPQIGGNVPISQPPAYQGDYTSPQIPSYMVPSIVSLVLWCVSMAIICLPIGLPFAIVALVYGTKVDSLRAQENLVAAAGASKSAKVWMIVSYSIFALPVLGLVGFILFIVVSGSP